MNKLNFFSVLFVIISIGLAIFAYQKNRSHNKILTQTTFSQQYANLIDSDHFFKLIDNQKVKGSKEAEDDIKRLIEDSKRGDDLKKKTGKEKMASYDKKVDKKMSEIDEVYADQSDERILKNEDYKVKTRPKKDVIVTVNTSEKTKSGGTPRAASRKDSLKITNENKTTGQKNNSVKEGTDSLSDTITLGNGNVVTTISKSMPNTTVDDRKYFAKIAITGILGLSALWVVLSGRYDEETKKWAFSVLTGIFGIWIGSST